MFIRTLKITRWTKVNEWIIKVLRSGAHPRSGHFHIQGFSRYTFLSEQERERRNVFVQRILFGKFYSDKSKASRTINIP